MTLILRGKPEPPSAGSANMRALGAIPLDTTLNPYVFTTTTLANAKSIGLTGLRFLANSRIDIHMSAMSPWHLPEGLYENKNSPYGSYNYKPSTNLALVVIDAATAVAESNITFFIHGREGVVTFDEIPLEYICEIFVRNDNEIAHSSYLKPGIRDSVAELDVINKEFEGQIRERAKKVAQTLPDESFRTLCLTRPLSPLGLCALGRTLPEAHKTLRLKGSS